jgi:hypothetical protein
MVRFGRFVILAAALAAGCQPAPGTPPPSKSSARGRTADEDKAVTRERLDKIGREFRSGAGMLPSMHYARSTNAPGLSWRVSLLPYLGETSLYKEFKLDEPWDSTHNKKLIEMIPEVLKSPRGRAPDGHTHYRAFVGPQAIFSPPKPAARVGEMYKALKDSAIPYFAKSTAGGTIPEVVTDGIINTLFFAEAAEAVPWTKPEELAYEAGKPLPKLGGVYDDGFFAVSAAGAVVFVPHRRDESTVRALITANANDPIEDKGILEQLNAPFPPRPAAAPPPKK